MKKNKISFTAFKTALLLFLVVSFLYGLGLSSEYFPVFRHDTPSFLISYNNVLIFVYIVLAFMILLFYLVWIYRIHVRLTAIDSRYPISPLEAVIKHFAPVYNIWWFIKIHLLLSAAAFQDDEERDEKIRGNILKFPALMILKRIFLLAITANMSNEFANDYLVFILLIVDSLIEVYALILYYQVCAGIEESLEA